MYSSPCSSDDSELEEYDEDMEGLTESQEPVLEPEYEILTSEQLVTDMMKVVDDVASVLNCPRAKCRLLLHHFKWSQERLLDSFCQASGNAKELLEKAHLAFSPISNPSTPASLTVAECGICCVEGALTGLPCGHTYCVSCWNQYLTTKVMDEGKSEIECLATKCVQLIDDDRAQSLMVAEGVRTRFRRLIANSFVAANKHIRWCPAPNCGHASKVLYVAEREIKCLCGMSYCFVCGAEWHGPVCCRLLKAWAQKCSDDSETSNWINANTKDCPKCQVTIEKNGGCNHMSCTNSGCKHHFCWVCLGDFKNYNHACNRFDGTAAELSKGKSRAALQRYLHYYNRFANHGNSLKFEHKLYEKVTEKMTQMQAASLSWIEVQYLKRAVDVLNDCRRTLMYTYAFAFYLQRNNQVEIFEDNQQDLESATEQLSAILERDLEEESDFNILKQRVLDKCKYLEARKNVLIAHCAEGDHKGFWKFTQ